MSSESRLPAEIEQLFTRARPTSKVDLTLYDEFEFLEGTRRAREAVTQRTVELSQSLLLLRERIEYPGIVRSPIVHERLSALVRPLTTLDLGFDSTQGVLLPGESSLEVGSAAQRISEYEGFSSRKRESEYLHRGRPDVWDLVVHFTSRSSFERILDASRIVAAPTGYFKVNAVCLTEAPLSFSAAFRDSYGPFGVVFRKANVLEVGGGPALYLTESALAAQKRIGVAAEAMPFMNVIRRGTRRMDFHHEREWRVPHDLDLESVRPEALVLPPATSGQRFGGKRWEEMLDAAWKWGEIG